MSGEFQVTVALPIFLSYCNALVLGVISELFLLKPSLSSYTL